MIEDAMTDTFKTCDTWLEPVSLLAAEALEPDEEPAVRQHLAECSGCRERLEQLRAACGGLRRAWPTCELAGDKVLAHVMNQIECAAPVFAEPLPSRQVSSRWKLVCAVTAAASVLAACGWLMWGLAQPRRIASPSQAKNWAGAVQVPQPAAEPDDMDPTGPTWIGLQRALLESDEAFETLLSQPRDALARHDASVIPTPLNLQAWLKES